MDPSFTNPKREMDRSEKHDGGLYGANGSVTSYEDIPGVDRLNNGSSADVMAETNRGAVMQALKNLQDKIQRLEIERSDAESDMRHLASETTRFRQLLSKKDERIVNSYESFEDRSRTFSRQKKEEEDKTSSLRIQPPTATSLLPSAPTPAYPETNGDTPSNAPKSQSVTVNSSKAQEMALSSAETRCTILEKQLAYMRTLLETAERDRNEAQRRSRNRGQQLTAWRNKAETHLRGLEDELRSERRKNRQLRDSMSLSGSQWHRGYNDWKEEAAKVQEPKVDVGEESNWMTPMVDQSWKSAALNQNGGLLVTSTPQKVTESSVVANQHKSYQRRPPLPCSTRARPSSVPFVVGRSVGPSHNVNVNLQTVLSMLTKHGASAEKTSSRRRRQARNHQVDRQMQEDVGVVLEELVDEFDHLCREHQTLVHQLAESTAISEKCLLEQRLSDLVNKMEMKGQQIGRLRSYMANISADSDSGKCKPETIRSTTEAHASHHSMNVTPSPPLRTVGVEKRQRSLHLLKNAKQWQACNLESKDISWR